MPSVQVDPLVDGDLVMHSHEAGDVTDLTTVLDPRYVNATGDTMTGNLAMGGYKITGLAAGTTNGDAVRFEQLHDAVTIGTNTASALSLSGQQISLGDKFVQIAGDTMTGSLNTTGIVSPTWRPASDSTTALQLQNAAGGSSVAVVDTTNNRLGINTMPAVAFHAVGQAQFDATWASNTVSIYVRNTAGAAFGAGSGVQLYADTTDYMGGFRALYRRSLSSADFDILVTDGSTPKMTVRGDGLVGIGTTAAGSLLHTLLTSAATNAVTNVITIGHDTSGTAAAGFGAGLLYQLESSTTAAQDAARIQVLWNDATHATRKADLVLTAYDSGGEREGLRIRGNGSAAAIGFFGTAPAERPTGVAVSAAGIHAALVTLGLITA